MTDGTRRSLLLGATAVALTPLPAFAAEPSVGDDGYFETWRELRPGVALIAQAKPFHLQPIGNVTVIDQADGLVLIDSGGSPGSGRRIVGLLKAHRPGKPVKAVILTHWHGDHPLGLPEILGAWPDARSIATNATRAHLPDPKTMNTPGAPDSEANARLVAKYRGFADYCRDMAGKATAPAEAAGWTAAARLFVQYAADMDGAITVAPAEGFDERLLIDDPERPVEALFLGRANTDGDALVRLPRQNIVATGDILVAPIPFGYGSYPAEWLAVLDKVSAMSPALLIPGHGEPMTDLGYLTRFGLLLEAVRGRVKRAAVEGADARAVRATVDLSDLRRDFTGDDPWLNRWFDAYWTDPIVVSAFKELKGEPIVQSLG